MAHSFEDRIRQAIETEQKHIDNRRAREHERSAANDRDLLSAGAFAGAIIRDIVKPRMYAARHVLPEGASVSVTADQSSRQASLSVRPGSNACIYIIVRFDDSDTVSIEASLTRPTDEDGKRLETKQPRVHQFKVGEGEHCSIEKWIDDQLVSLVPELLRACS